MLPRWGSIFLGNSDDMEVSRKASCKVIGFGVNSDAHIDSLRELRGLII